MQHKIGYLRLALVCATCSVGYCLLAINGSPVTNKCLEDDQSTLVVVNNPKNYPLSLKFAWVRVSIDERIMLLSMFHL